MLSELAIADVAGAAVSEGFIHSCLARASSLAAGTVAVIRALIAARPADLPRIDEIRLSRPRGSG